MEANGSKTVLSSNKMTLKKELYYGILSDIGSGIFFDIERWNVLYFINFIVIIIQFYIVAFFKLRNFCALDCKKPA